MPAEDNNRLQQGDGIWGTLTWAYDATGNRTSEVLTSGSTTTSTYNYPGTSNKLASITQGASTVRSFSAPTRGAAPPTPTATTTATGSISFRSDQRSPPTMSMTGLSGLPSAPRRT